MVQLPSSLIRGREFHSGCSAALLSSQGGRCPREAICSSTYELNANNDAFGPIGTSNLPGRLDMLLSVVFGASKHLTAVSVIEEADNEDM